MKVLVFIFVVLIIFPNFNFPNYSQTTERKKPRIKNFGKSLDPNAKNNLKNKNRVKNAEAAEDSDVIKINTNLVVLDCLVVDSKGAIVSGLRSDDFIISEDNTQQQIELFSLGDDAKIPRSIVLIIDYSGSQLPYIEQSVQAAKLLVDKLRTNDLMAIVTDDIEIISQFTADKKSLKKTLDTLRIKNDSFSRSVGKSQQLSALYSVLNEMFDDSDVRPIIIFQTDGDELAWLSDGFGDLIFPSPYTRKASFSTSDLSELIDNSRAPIYTVFPGAKLLGLSEEEKKKKLEAERLRRLKALGINPEKVRQPTKEETESLQAMRNLIKQYYPNGMPDAQEYLSNLSQQTGGWIEFLEEPEQADGIYNRILSELNTRYIIGYLPTNEAKDGKRRKVKIEIKNHPEYKIFGKTSYIPSATVKD